MLNKGMIDSGIKFALYPNRYRKYTRIMMRKKRKEKQERYKNTGLEENEISENEKNTEGNRGLLLTEVSYSCSSSSSREKGRRKIRNFSDQSSESGGYRSKSFSEKNENSKNNRITFRSHFRASLKPGDPETIKDLLSNQKNYV